MKRFIGLRKHTILLAMVFLWLVIMGCGNTLPAAITADTPSEGGNVSMIAKALGRLQAEGGNNNFVIFIADADRNYYIQFTGARGQGELYAEAVSNQFLEPANALTDDQMARLESLGWIRQEGNNYYRNWTAASDSERLAIAQEVVQTFVEVYGIGADDPIQTELTLE
jgi:hypothetical protein